MTGRFSLLAHPPNRTRNMKRSATYTGWIGMGMCALVVGGCGGGTGASTGTGGGVTTETGGTGAVGTGGTGAVGMGGIPATGGTTATGGSPGTGGTGPVDAPGAFDLIGPGQGSSAQPLTPQLSWQASAGATAYAVEIATSPAFGSADVFSQMVNGSTTTLTVPASTLLPGVVYYWRVSAENSGTDYTIATGAPQWFSSPYQVDGAHGLAVTPDGSRVVVASDVSDGTVDIIDLTTHTVGGIQTGLHSKPVGVAVAADGKQALATLVANAADGINGVAIIDLLQNRFVGRIGDPCVGTTLTGIAYFPNGAAAIPDLGADCISMGLSGFTPDPSSPNFSFTNLPDTSNPWDVAIDPTGTFALVTMEASDKLYRIDFGVAVSSYSLSAPSAGVAITPDGKTAVVAEATLDLIDLTSGDITPIQLYQDNLGDDIHNVAITPDGEVAGVVGAQSIQFVSLKDGSIMAAYPAANGSSIAFTPDGSYAYVSDRADGWVRVMPIP